MVEKIVTKKVHMAICSSKVFTSIDQRELGTCEEKLDVGRGHAPWQWKTADNSLFGGCQWEPFSTVSRDLVLVATSPSLPSLKDMESNGKSEE